MSSIRVCASCGAENRIPDPRLGQRGKCGACKAELAPDGKPVDVGAKRFEGAVLGAKVPVLVDFWSPTCPPCRMLAPELEKLARKKSGALLVAKVDTHSEPALAHRYGIEVVPTMILFEDGREVRRITGAMPAAQIERSLGV